MWPFKKKTIEIPKIGKSNPNPLEIIKKINNYTRMETLVEKKVALKTPYKNFILVLKDRKVEASIKIDLGRGTPTQFNPLFAKYQEECTVSVIRDEIVRDSHLAWDLLQAPGTTGPLVLPDSIVDTELKHSIRRQDIESVRIIWVKKTEISIRDPFCESI